MPQLKITTFNVENLFSRYVLLDGLGDPSAHVQLAGVTSIDRNGKPVSEATTLIQRNNTARAILDARPDIAAFVEVESLWTLRCFNDQYLGGYFGPMVLIAGNDGRGINVALCLRHGLDSAVSVSAIRSHVDEVNPGNEKAKRVNRYYDEATNELQVTGALFSRDCLEVDIDAWSSHLTFLVNHFKSQDGSKGADALREAQATRVAELVAEVKSRRRLPVVLGDLNQDWDKGSCKPLQPLKHLVSDKILVDPFQSVEDKWTHFYAVGDETSRLDYILLASELKVIDTEILRAGLSLRCKTAAARYPTIGHFGTEASDHCPVSVSLSID